MEENFDTEREMNARLINNIMEQAEKKEERRRRLARWAAQLRIMFFIFGVTLITIIPALNSYGDKAIMDGVIYLLGGIFIGASMSGITFDYRAL